MIKYMGAMRVVFSTRQMAATYAAIETVARANGTAAARAERAAANARKTMQTVGAELGAYDAVGSRVGLRDPQELLSYVYYDGFVGSTPANPARRDGTDFMVSAGPGWRSLRRR